VWDVTVVASLADSYVDRSVTGAGFVAEMAGERKLDKYSPLSSNYIIQPVTMENFVVFGESTLNFLVELGRRLCDVSAAVRREHSVSACICCNSTLQFRAVA